LLKSTGGFKVFHVCGRWETIRRAGAGGCVVFLLAGGLSAFGASPDLTTIVKDMKRASEPMRPCVRRITVMSTKPTGEKKVQTTQFTAMQANKAYPDGRRMAIVMLEPAAVRGSGVMIREGRNENRLVSVYMKVFQRPVDETSLQFASKWLATDFTYADLGFIPIGDTYRLLGEDVFGGVPVYKIHQVPKERTYYSHMVLYISKASMLLLERDYYDRANVLWKTETLKDFRTVDGVPTAMDVVLKDLQAGTQTEIGITQIKYDVKIPDDVFDPLTFPRLLDSIAWKMLPLGANR
jgi:hypothetical protein